MGTQEKDIEGFNRVYNENKELIFRTAIKFSGNYHAAQEIVQNTFLKLYANYNTYDMEFTVKWLVETTKNAAINYGKKSKREIPDEDVERKLEHSDCAESSEDVVFKAMRDEALKKLKDNILEELYQLNERWYDAMTMVYCMGRSQQEVADELGVSIEVLHSVLYRARNWIKKNYKVQYETTKYL